MQRTASRPEVRGILRVQEHNKVEPMMFGLEVRTVRHHLVARRHVRNDEYLIRISDSKLRFRTRAVQETDRQTC